jgi:ParB-like partition proteins
MNSNSEVVMLSTFDILPNRFQPRIKFKEGKINELAESIKKYGVIQPIIVRKIADKYEIIAGERRFKATMQAGLTHIPAIINNLNDADSSEIALIENVQREDLTPIEESVSYKRILDMSGMTQETLASKLGISQSAVANKLRLLQLTDEVQEALLEGRISERHARSLIKVSDEEKQKDLLSRVMKERLTVRKLDNEIKNIEKEEPEEIEVLDLFESIYNEKGNNDMNNNDPINQFDLPQTNIVNDTPVAPVASPTPQPVVAPTPVEMNTIPETPPTMEPAQTLNPGFMDIDKIEREATDISQLQTVASNSTAEEPAPVPVVETNTQPIGGGRFFDNFDVANNNNMTNNNPEGAFNFNFDPVQTPAAEVAPVAPVQEVAPTVFENPNISPIITPEPVQEIAPAAEPTPIMSEFGTDINNLVTEETVQFEPIANVETSPTEPVENEVTPAIQEPIVEPIVPEVAPVTPIVEPTVEAITPAIPVQETVVEPITVEPAPIGGSIVSSTIQENQAIGNVASLTQPVLEQVTTPISFNTKEGIDKVRNIVRELESSGFRVTSEEADSEGNYEIKIIFEK